jgi:hypothetical protein
MDRHGRGKVAGSDAATTTSACLNSVTPRGDLATGRCCAHAVINTALIRKRLLE